MNAGTNGGLALSPGDVVEFSRKIVNEIETRTVRSIQIGEWMTLSCWIL